MSIFVGISNSKKTVFEPLQRFSGLQSHHFRKHENPSTSTPFTREVWVPAHALLVTSVIMSHMSHIGFIIHVNRASHKNISIAKFCSNSVFTGIWTTLPLPIKRIEKWQFPIMQDCIYENGVNKKSVLLHQVKYTFWVYFSQRSNFSEGREKETWVEEKIDWHSFKYLYHQHDQGEIFLIPFS